MRKKKLHTVLSHYRTVPSHVTELSTLDYPPLAVHSSSSWSLSHSWGTCCINSISPSTQAVWRLCNRWEKCFCWTCTWPPTWTSCTLWSGARHWYRYWHRAISAKKTTTSDYVSCYATDLCCGFAKWYEHLHHSKVRYPIIMDYPIIMECDSTLECYGLLIPLSKPNL